MKWLLESNRLKHLIAGAIIAAVSIVFFSVTEDIQNDIKLFLYTLFVVLVAMASVEYIQKINGGKFDFLDILAGILVPLICIIIVSIIIL